MNKLTYLDDFNNAPDVDHFDLIQYAAVKKDFNIDLTDFLLIEEGFRKKWNASTGELVGDGDFKNAVYRHLEASMNEKVIEHVIPQDIVDASVDLILDYMSEIGQWYSDFSEN